MSGRYHIRNGERGNALWLILVTIALLAALTLTISSLSDSTEQSGNVERARIQASAIMRHTAGVREAIERLRVAGTGEAQMSFDVSYLSSSLYANPNCTGSDCLIYGSAGGGISYEVPDTDWLESSASGNTRYGEWEYSGANAVPAVGTARPELLAYLSYLREDLCTQIDSMLNVAGGIPTDGDGFDTTTFQGAFSASGTIDNMDGYEAGCFKDGGGTRGYVFYQVLIKR